MKQTDIPTTSAEKVDGGESTPPSMEKAPAAKPESKPFEKRSESSKNVTPHPQGDIFDDLAALGRTLDELTPSEKILTGLSIRKPKRDEWVRCHGEIHTPVNLYQSTAGDVYLVLPSALEALESVTKHVRLRLAVTYTGEAFVWPVAVPSVRKPMPCHVTAATASEAAVEKWIRIAWKSHDYEVVHRSINGKEPSWPTEITSASEMLRFVSETGGFEIIDSINHPVVRELRGLA